MQREVGFLCTTVTTLQHRKEYPSNNQLPTPTTRMSQKKLNSPEGRRGWNFNIPFVLLVAAHPQVNFVLLHYVFYTFGHVGGKNKKTHKCQFFFSSGTFSARQRNRGPKNMVSVV